LPEIVDPAFKHRMLVSDIRDPKTSTPAAKKKKNYSNKINYIIRMFTSKNYWPTIIIVEPSTNIIIIIR